MIVEELIFFDQEKLRPVRSIQDRLKLTKNFFLSVSPVSTKKLDLLIELLKEREVEERPYTYPGINFLLSICLIVVASALIFSFIGNTPLKQIRYEILGLTSILFTGWSTLTVYISKKLKQRKYQRLIQVLELYRAELSNL